MEQKEGTGTGVDRRKSEWEKTGTLKRKRGGKSEQGCMKERVYIY